jgi:hypothetical protein
VPALADAGGGARGGRVPSLSLLSGHLRRV